MALLKKSIVLASSTLIVALAIIFYWQQQDTCQTSGPIMCVFAHGFRQNNGRAALYEDILGIKLISFDFPDATNTRETDLAQERDLEPLAQTCCSTVNSPECSNGFGLIGVSRGAAAVLVYASKKPEGLRFVIAESPFDHIDNVKMNMLARYNCDWLAPSVADALFAQMFPHHKPDGLHPIDVIANIDPCVPVLLICSEADIVVPHTSTIQLYTKLKASRQDRNNVHLIVFKTGTHARLVHEMKEEYTQAITDFLNAHGLRLLGR